MRIKAVSPFSQATSNFSSVYSIGKSHPKYYMVTIQYSWSGMSDDDSDSDRGGARLVIEIYLDFHPIKALFYT